MPTPTEAKTRTDLINPALERAGWNLSDRNQVGLEIPVDDVEPAAWHALEARLRQMSDPSTPYDAQLPACIRDQQREAQRQAEHLFQTLLHRAFRGEL